MLYLIFLAAALCGAYLFLFFLFPKFFEHRRANAQNISFYSLLSIVTVSFIVFTVSANISNDELANRILHIFGGGFLSFLICFFAAKDSGVAINKFQFFVISFLVVTTMGVGNEILEFFLQRYFDFTFAETITDTWLDLISNTLGALLASALLTPFVRSKSVDNNY